MKGLSGFVAWFRKGLNGVLGRWAFFGLLTLLTTIPITSQVGPA